MKKFINFILFAIYCTVLFTVLFFRAGNGVCADLEAMKVRFAESANLIPFKTIDNYIKAYKEGIISIEYIRLNLPGNILLFVPMGIYLPLLFKKYKNHLKFIVTTITIIIAVEISQFILGVGRMDIDDLILNLTGAIFGRLLYDIFLTRKKSCS